MQCSLFVASALQNCSVTVCTRPRNILFLFTITVVINMQQYQSHKVLQSRPSRRMASIISQLITMKLRHFLRTPGGVQLFVPPAFRFTKDQQFSDSQERLIKSSLSSPARNYRHHLIICVRHEDSVVRRYSFIH
jgi:hypothetical protein